MTHTNTQTHARTTALRRAHFRIEFCLNEDEIKFMLKKSKE